MPGTYGTKRGTKRGTFIIPDHALIGVIQAQLAARDLSLGEHLVDGLLGASVSFTTLSNSFTTF
jgi:hypothetical protein